jgi:hypothetical protein
MKGRIVEEFTDEVTHLVTDDLFSPEYAVSSASCNDFPSILRMRHFCMNYVCNDLRVHWNTIVGGEEMEDPRHEVRLDQRGIREKERGRSGGL